MIFFTICSRNFAGYSGALWSSLRKIYPDVKFYLVLCDDENGFDYPALQYPILKMRDLGISNIDNMKLKYNITELNTSLKPFAFEYLFNLHPGEPVVYLDPDIFVVSRLEELEQNFRDGYDCVLTPHICEPAEYAEMSDLKFLTYGIYNFGFCALRDTPQTRRLVAWWGRRLEEYCSIDSARGLFVDQKWGDYFAAFIEKTKILRHPGYNVAYWNLAQRKLTMRDGQWLSNGLPLRFIHFSGNRIEDAGVFTRHAGQFNVRNTPELVGLLDTYREAIFENGHSYYSVIPYAFSWSGVGGFNEHTPETLRRRAHDEDVRRPHLPITEYHSHDQFVADRRFNARSIARRRDVEQASTGKGNTFETEGYCSVCNRPSRFVTSMMYSIPDGKGGMLPNWREHLSCTDCGFVNRVRAVIDVVEQRFPVPRDASVYITERVTPLYEKLKDRWPLIIGSEFFGTEIEPGDIVNGVRNENIENLSFPSASLDFILSLDVLEHVPHPDTAFEEVFRCLRPGGVFVFTVPFDCTIDADKVRAILHEDGELEHLMDPEYHGNPIDMENGALCFRYFSWDTVRRLKDTGFEDAGVLSCWSQDLMHYGDQFILFARKAHVGAR